MSLRMIASSFIFESLHEETAYRQLCRMPLITKKSPLEGEINVRIEAPAPPKEGWSTSVRGRPTGLAWCGSRSRSCSRVRDPGSDKRSP